MNTIEITSAKNNYQTATINGKNYEFEFDESDLITHILDKYSTRDLDRIIGLDPDEHSYEQMGQILSENWLHEDIETLICDFITKNPSNLIDHLIESK